MKLSPATSEKLKFVGGAIIVLAAAAIMFPGFLSLAWGLWRIFLILLVVGGSSLAITYATRHFARLKANRALLPAGTDERRLPVCDSGLSPAATEERRLPACDSGLPPAATDS